MSVIIRLQGLPWTASAGDIRLFFQGLNIPDGGVHIVGGDRGDAFIAFTSDEDARLAMQRNNGYLKDSAVQLFLSSKTEMQNVIAEARDGHAPRPSPIPISHLNTPPPVNIPLEDYPRMDSGRRAPNMSHFGPQDDSGQRGLPPGHRPPLDMPFRGPERPDEKHGPPELDTREGIDMSGGNYIYPRGREDQSEIPPGHFEDVFRPDQQFPSSRSPFSKEEPRRPNDPQRRDYNDPPGMHPGGSDFRPNSRHQPDASSRGGYREDRRESDRRQPSDRNHRTDHRSGRDDRRRSSDKSSDQSSSRHSRDWARRNDDRHDQGRLSTRSGREEGRFGTENFPEGPRDHGDDGPRDREGFSQPRNRDSHRDPLLLPTHEPRGPSRHEEPSRPGWNRPDLRDMNRNDSFRPGMHPGDAPRPDLNRPDRRPIDIDHTGTSRPDRGRHDMGRPDVTQMGMNIPDIDPSSMNPDIAEPDFNRPNMALRDLHGPPLEIMHMSRPDISPIEVPRNRPDRSRPGPPDRNTPDIPLDRTDRNRSGISVDRPDRITPDIPLDRPDRNRPGNSLDRPDRNRPDIPFDRLDKNKPDPHLERSDRNRPNLPIGRNDRNKPNPHDRPDRNRPNLPLDRPDRSKPNLALDGPDRNRGGIPSDRSNRNISEIPIERPERNRPDRKYPVVDLPDRNGSGIIQPDSKRPEIGIPDMGRPGMGRPEIDRLELERPDLGRPDIGRLDMGRPDIGRPGIGRPDIGRPDMGRPDMGRPDMRRPDMRRPDMGRPDMGRPDMERPDMGRPGMGRPGMGRPDMGTPDIGRPDIGRPDIGRPDMARPSLNRPDRALLDPGRPDMGRPDMGRTAPNRPQISPIVDISRQDGPLSNTNRRNDTHDYPPIPDQPNRPDPKIPPLMSQDRFPGSEPQNKSDFIPPGVNNFRDQDRRGPLPPNRFLGGLLPDQGDLGPPSFSKDQDSRIPPGFDNRLEQRGPTPRGHQRQEGPFVDQGFNARFPAPSQPSRFPDWDSAGHQEGTPKDQRNNRGPVVQPIGIHDGSPGTDEMDTNEFPNQPRGNRGRISLLPNPDLPRLVNVDQDNRPPFIGRNPDFNRGSGDRPHNNGFHNNFREDPDFRKESHQRGFPPRGRMGEGPGDRPGQFNNTEHHVRVGNMPLSITYSMLRRFFDGLLIPRDGIKLINNNEGKRCGLGYVKFSTRWEADKALAANGRLLAGCRVDIQPCGFQEFEAALDSYPSMAYPLSPKRQMTDRINDRDHSSPKRLKADSPAETKPATPTRFVIMLRDVAHRATSQDLKKYFEGLRIANNGQAIFADVDSAGNTNGIVYVELTNRRDFNAALERNYGRIVGRIVYVSAAESKDIDRIKEKLELRQKELETEKPKESPKPRQSPEDAGKQTPTPAKAPTPSKPTASAKKPVPSKTSTPAKAPATTKASTPAKAPATSKAPVTPKAPAKKETQAPKSETKPKAAAKCCVKINGLPSGVSKKDIEEFFKGLEIAPKGYSPVLKKDGTCTGDAFVEFVNPSDCQKASAKNQQTMKDKKVSVQVVAKEKMESELEELRKKALDVSQTPTPQPQRPPPLYFMLGAQNLPYTVSIGEILNFFRGYNPVPESIRLHYNNEGRATGDAVIGFMTESECHRALRDLNSRLLGRRNIRLFLA